MKDTEQHIDYRLFYLIIFLISFSCMFFSALTAPFSLKNFGNTNYYLFHQITHGFLPGIILGFLAFKIPLFKIKNWSFILFVLNLIALFLVFIPGIGVNAGRSTRWLNLGFFSFQPSEFFKIISILYLSAWISSKLSEAEPKGWKLKAEKSYHNIIYILFPFMLFLALIFSAFYLQKDATTMGVIALTLLVLYFSSKTPLWHTIFVIFLGLSGLLLLIKFEPYRLARWVSFLNPELDPLGKGLQLKQSLISLGSGGIFGRGLGMSGEKFFLPESTTDSIFAIIGEELGIFGCLVLLSAFIYLFWLGINIAKRSTDKFSKMISVGIVTWITLQAFINISSVVGIFPVTGVPLPFSSYGGSHLVVELIGMGLLLNVSKNS